MIFVNFKTYEQGTGEKAFQLAEICQRVSRQTSLEIIPVVQAADIFRLVSAGLKVWSQHADDIGFGPNTGQTLPEAVLLAGSQGTILNHSENKLPVEVIGSILAHCQKIGLKTLVCSESVEEGKQIAQFKPDFIAYEPPELIGTGTSVSLLKPEIIKDFASQIPDFPLIIGAGIHTTSDIKKGLELGAKGFLISSEILLTTDPEKELLKLAEGFAR